MTLSVPGVPASCEKFPRSSQLNFWSTESIFNQFSMFLKTLNALCVWLQYEHPRSIKRVIGSDKPVTLLLLLWSHKCDFGAEPRSRIIATWAGKGLNKIWNLCTAYPALPGGSRRWEQSVCYPGNTADRQTQRALTYYHLSQSTANQNGKLTHYHRWDSNLWSLGC
jgi:hypothetical protein